MKRWQSELEYSVTAHELPSEQMTPIRNSPPGSGRYTSHDFLGIESEQYSLSHFSKPDRCGGTLGPQGQRRVGGATRKSFV